MGKRGDRCSPHHNYMPNVLERCGGLGRVLIVFNRPAVLVPSVIVLSCNGMGKHGDMCSPRHSCMPNVVATAAVWARPHCLCQATGACAGRHCYRLLSNQK